jgi:hypothetical protein
MIPEITSQTGGMRFTNRTAPLCHVLRAPFADPCSARVSDGLHGNNPMQNESNLRAHKFQRPRCRRSGGHEIDRIPEVRMRPIWQ